MEAERDRLSRLRQVALSRPPPKWMRRLAAKLNIAGNWRTERLGTGEERMVFEDGTQAR